MSETKPHVLSEDLSLSERLAGMNKKGTLDVLGKNLEDAGQLETSLRHLEDMSRRIEDGLLPTYRTENSPHDSFFNQYDLGRYKKEVGDLLSKLHTFMEQAEGGTLNPENVGQWQRDVHYITHGSMNKV